MKQSAVTDSIARLLEFVENHGGENLVSKKIGKSSQLFYNYRNGLSKPGTEFYLAIKSAFPDFDANYILFGEKPEEPQQGASVDDRELQYLKRENQLLQSFLREKGVDLGKCRPSEWLQVGRIFRGGFVPGLRLTNC